MARDEGPLIETPALVLVTDGARLTRNDLAGVVDKAVAGGVDIVQLRENRLGTSDLVDLGRQVQDVIAGRALLMINEDLDAMFALKADGIHLKEGSNIIDDIRDLRTSARFLRSRAVHSIEAALLTAADFATDVLQVGTLFETRSKPGVQPMGIACFDAICRAVNVPVIGIGGVNASNAGDVIRAGASGIAVIGAILDSPDPKGAAERLRESIDAATTRPVRPIRYRRWEDR